MLPVYTQAHSSPNRSKRSQPNARCYGQSTCRPAIVAQKELLLILRNQLPFKVQCHFQKLETILIELHYQHSSRCLFYGKQKQTMDDEQREY